MAFAAVSAGVREGAGRPAPSFDRVARAYRWMEALSFGRSLRRTREEFLPQLGEARHALVLGDGDGRFLAALLRRNAALRAVAIDASGRMLQLLRERCAFAGDRLRLREGDLRGGGAALGDGAPYDLVVSHFFLDCLDEEDVAELAREVRGNMRPGALWVVSEFRVPPRGWLRWPAALLIRAMYGAFGVLTGLRVRRLPGYSGIFAEAGLCLVERRLRLRGLLTAELWRAGRVR